MSDFVDQQLDEIRKDINEILNLQLSIIKTQARFDKKLRELEPKIIRISKIDKTIIRDSLKKKIQRVVNKEDRYSGEEIKNTEGFCVHCGILVVGEYGYQVSKESKNHCQTCYDKHHKK